MGHRARALTLAAALPLGLVACGDLVVVIGDAPRVVRIVAGIPDSTGDAIGSRATESALNGPHGLAVDADGVLYIADRGNARILSVTPSGRIDVLIDHGGRSDGPRLRAPEDLALDGMGGLLVADSRAHRVWRVGLADGRFDPIAGTGTAGTAPDTVEDALTADLDTPVGVAVDDDGTVYFSEFSRHRIRRVEPDKRLVTLAGDGIGDFRGDDGPARNARLRRPAGLDLSSDALYIADSGNHRVRAIDLGDLTIRTVAGTGVDAFDGDAGPAVEASLDTPHDVAIFEDDRLLFIADTENHRVRMVNLRTGVITTLAGTGATAFNGDLIDAASTALAEPRGLAFAPPGFLFLSDTGHQIVRRTAVTFVEVF